MSRVTIRELLYECNQPMGPEDFVKMQKILDIEITPRRAIEMIIEMCKKNEEALQPYYGEPFEDGADMAYMIIRDYAEELLETFES